MQGTTQAHEDTEVTVDHQRALGTKLWTFSGDHSTRSNPAILEKSGLQGLLSR